MDDSRKIKRLNLIKGILQIVLQILMIGGSILITLQKGCNQNIGVTETLERNVQE